MDKTIEIVLVATVTIVAAAILIMMVQGESSDVTDRFDSILQNTECSSEKSKWKTAIENGNDGKASTIKSNARDKCDTGTWEEPRSPNEAIEGRSGR